MDYELLKPWVVVGGYLLAFGLMLLADRLPDAVGGKRWLPRSLSWAAGAVASATTLYWFTWGTFAGPAAIVWAVFPLVVAAFIWWRRHRRGEWMDRLAARGGVLLDAAHPAPAGFGVLPAVGRAVDRGEPGASYDAGVEFSWQGLRVLGVEYGPGQPDPERAPGKFEQAVDLVGNRSSLVQVQTPRVPALVITPRTTRDQHEDFGPLEPSEFRPLQDGRLARNTYAAVRPAVGLEPVEFPDDAAFTRQFSVRSADSEFARAALTPQARRAMLTDDWLQTHEVVLHNGALWASSFGGLTERGLFDDLGHLTGLAGSLDRDAWRHSAGVDDERFLSAVSSATAGTQARTEQRTVLKWAAWLLGLGALVGSLVALADFAPRQAVVVFLALGAVPALAAAARGPFNRRRAAAGRRPLSTRALIVRTLIVLGLLVPGASLTANAVLAVTGLADRVEVTVTGVSCTTSSDGTACSNNISGTYQLDGETRFLDDEPWLAWQMFTELPAKGDVVQVALGPVWWNPMIETTGVGVLLGLLGLVLLGAGAIAGRFLLDLSPKQEDAEGFVSPG